MRFRCVLWSYLQFDVSGSHCILRPPETGCYVTHLFCFALLLVFFFDSHRAAPLFHKNPTKKREKKRTKHFFSRKIKKWNPLAKASIFHYFLFVFDESRPSSGREGVSFEGASTTYTLFENEKILFSFFEAVFRCVILARNRPVFVVKLIFLLSRNFSFAKSTLFLLPPLNFTIRMRWEKKERNSNLATEFIDRQSTLRVFLPCTAWNLCSLSPKVDLKIYLENFTYLSFHCIWSK